MVHLRHRNLLQTMVATIFPPFYRHRAARKQYFCLFIVTAQRGNNIFAFLSSPRSAGIIFSRFIVTARRGNNIFAFLSSPCGAGTIFLLFYRHRAAREQYFCVLSSPCSAGTIFLPFYRHRAAREQYFRCFIVVVQRGNNIFAVLSSPCGAETIFPPFQCLQCSSNTFPNGFGFCRPTASVQKCGENRAGMAAGLVQRGK